VLVLHVLPSGASKEFVTGLAVFSVQRNIATIVARGADYSNSMIRVANERKRELHYGAEELCFFAFEASAGCAAAGDFDIAGCDDLRPTALVVCDALAARWRPRGEVIRAGSEM